MKRFYFKSNFKSATPIVNGKDIEKLKDLNKLVNAANNNCKIAIATIQRLVNSDLLPEGNY